MHSPQQLEDFMIGGNQFVIQKCVKRASGQQQAEGGCAPAAIRKATKVFTTEWNWNIDDQTKNN